jgi:UDP-glucose 4-epimerase
VLAKFITQMLDGLAPTIFGDGKQSRDFTYVDNVLEANLLACSAERDDVAGRVFNVATAQRTDLYQTFLILKKLTGYSGEVSYGPERAGDVKHSLADISLAEKHLGYKPKVDFEEGLSRTVAWYRTRELEALGKPTTSRVQG